MKVKVKKLHPGAILPQYQSVGAACFDLHAVVEEPGLFVPIEHGKPISFGTGLAFEIPQGWAMLIFSRSGQGFNTDVRLSNCVGIIDSDYRGEVRVKLARDESNAAPYLVQQGDRIAQAFIVPLATVAFIEAEDLTETERGADGLGSTGQ